MMLLLLDFIKYNDMYHDTTDTEGSKQLPIIELHKIKKS